MPKRTTAIAAVVVMLFALTGCGEETATPADEPKPFAAPLTATEAPETPDAGAPEVDESAYITQLRDALDINGAGSVADASDAQLIAAGNEACQQMRDGAGIKEVRVIENEPESEVGYVDSRLIAAVASVHLCAEFDPGA